MHLTQKLSKHINIYSNANGFNSFGTPKSGHSYLRNQYEPSPNKNRYNHGIRCESAREKVKNNRKHNHKPNSNSTVSTSFKLSGSGPSSSSYSSYTSSLGTSVSSPSSSFAIHLSF